VLHHNREEPSNYPNHRSQHQQHLTTINLLSQFSTLRTLRLQSIQFSQQKLSNQLYLQPQLKEGLQLQDITLRIMWHQLLVALEGIREAKLP
jgi:hypothetical protein